MSEFTSSFWDFYIGVVTVVSIVACAVFLWMQSVRRVSGTQTETTGHTWDEDLGEYNNPLPRWWMWLFYITVVFALAYLVLYPGLGSFNGIWNWTQVRQFEEELNKSLSAFIRDPQVVVNVMEFRSQPVSVLGAVNQPGTHQLRVSAVSQTRGKLTVRTRPGYAYQPSGNGPAVR